MLTNDDLKKISKVIDDKFEEKFIKLFNQGFEEVVMPRLEETDLEMEKGFKRMNAKLDYINQRIDNHATKLDQQEKRTSKLEAAAVAD